MNNVDNNVNNEFKKALICKQVRNTCAYSLFDARREEKNVSEVFAYTYPLLKWPDIHTIGIYHCILYFTLNSILFRVDGIFST